MNERQLREGYQPSYDIAKKGYQPKGERPPKLDPPKVGSAAVKPTEIKNNGSAPRE